jgi:hypothetical protein
MSKEKDYGYISSLLTAPAPTPGKKFTYWVSYKVTGTYLEVDP